MPSKNSYAYLKTQRKTSPRTSPTPPEQNHRKHTELNLLRAVKLCGDETYPNLSTPQPQERIGEGRLSREI